MHIPRIVITGGPCGGKTTALAAIHDWCQEHGYTPMIVPEAATNLIDSGLNPTHPTFQELVLLESIHAERLRRKAVEFMNLRKPVFILDRGLADGRAYVTEAQFTQVLASQGLGLVDARDQYDSVIFLDSAAVGAEKAYTTANNTARRETVEEAKEINQRTLDAWIGAPRLLRVTNKPDQTFADKIHVCLAGVANTLKESAPLRIEKKYLIETPNLSELPTHTAPISIIQTYLTDTGGGPGRLRARGQYGQDRYFHHLKQPVSEDSSILSGGMIDFRQYERLRVHADLARVPITKTRHCFEHGGRYFELDQFHGHHQGLWLLETAVHNSDDAVDTPSFISIDREVTGDPKFLNYNLAKAA